MDYRNILRDSNETVKEQYDLFMFRIRAIIEEKEIEKLAFGQPVKDYFISMARFLISSDDTYRKIREQKFFEQSFEELKKENREFYSDILGEAYETSYANPAYAVKTLGEEYGRILSFLYTELRTIREYVFEQNLEKMAILLELFLGVYFRFEHEQVTYKQIRESVYSYMYDYADEWISWRVRQQLDPDLNFATSIVMDSDLSNPKYLYSYGKYVTENEHILVDFFSEMNEGKIEEMAETVVNAFLRGLAIKGVDIDTKSTVDLQYNLGYERVVRRVIEKFKNLGLEPILYPAATNSIIKRQISRVGYLSSSANKQYRYDHRFDDAIYYDKRMVDRKISCIRRSLEEYADEAAAYAGYIRITSFGEAPFEPVQKKENYRLSERQENLKAEFENLYNGLLMEYANKENQTYTLISYPGPAVGADFPEIFDAVHKINTEDTAMLAQVQQRLIMVLDQAKYIKIMGRKRNMTNITIQLKQVEDLDHQTCFRNCLSDVNVPAGEVFTCPELKGTEGLLHISDIYLNNVKFKELRLNFADGMITDYSCTNYEDEEVSKHYIKEHLLGNRATLPIGGFAFGTNTAIYVMAAKFGIVDVLSRLLSIKMGPHLVLGDTFFAYMEEETVKNPDGREMVVKDNECSKKRFSEPKKAYFNYRTNISIPYEDIGRIVAVTSDRIEIPIILDGRFVLDGTFGLNKAFRKD